VPASTIPPFLQAGCPSLCPTNSVKTLKATGAFGLGEDARVLLSGVTCTISIPPEYIMRKLFDKNAETLKCFV